MTLFAFMTEYLVAIEDPVAAIPLGVCPHTLKITKKKKGAGSSKLLYITAMRTYSFDVTSTLES